MQIPKLFKKRRTSWLLVIEKAGSTHDRGPKLNTKQQGMEELAFKGRYMASTSPGSVALGT